MSDTLLPSNATEAEIALDLATSRIGDVPIIGRQLWNPQTCPPSLLPWLAWALGVDEWDATWPDEAKRATISASVSVHRHKGTVAAVRAMIANAGFGDATLIERWGGRTYNGTTPRNGTMSRAQTSHWARYRIYLSRPITLAQADTVRRLLATVAPIRCHLDQINFTQALHLYNATVPRDGTYSRGVA